jgi:hypothetical protein
MPVAIIMDFEGGTLDQYDQVVQAMGLSPGGPTPPGALFHWVTETDNGVRVTDVWETREAFDQFAQEQIGPHTAAAGLSEPQMTVHDTHNHLIKSS